MTLREIHERCKARHKNQMSRRNGHPLSVVCTCCGTSWPCPDYSDAVAAIAILDAAGVFDRAVSVFDRAVIGSTRDEHGEPAYLRCRCVLDPEPSA